MRIYFVDGLLDEKCVQKFDRIIDAKYGYTHNKEHLLAIKKEENELSVYTNSLVALSNEYAWNEILQIPELYFRKNDEFVRIDQLTNRQLREGHNLMKMFFSGEFDDE